MSKINNLTGQRFDRLLVLSLDKTRTATRGCRWLCLCKCGKDIVIVGNHLLKKHTKSCGCLRKEAAGLVLKTGKKKCFNCKVPKNTSEFSAYKKKLDKLQAYCKECAQKTQEKRKYNIDAENKADLLNKQNNRCAICNEETKLCVDHDHKTKKVRGLLCHNCNKGLGYFKDSIESLLAAIDYIKNPPADSILYG
jgi:hypothetical protein